MTDVLKLNAVDKFLRVNHRDPCEIVTELQDDESFDNVPRLERLLAEFRAYLTALDEAWNDDKVQNSYDRTHGEICDRSDDLYEHAEELDFVFTKILLSDTTNTQTLKDLIRDVKNLAEAVTD